MLVFRLSSKYGKEKGAFTTSMKKLFNEPKMAARFPRPLVPRELSPSYACLKRMVEQQTEH